MAYYTFLLSKTAFTLNRKADILNCLEEGTEGCITLVGGIKTDRVISAFVRLGSAIVMHNTIEVCC